MDDKEHKLNEKQQAIDILETKEDEFEKRIKELSEKLALSTKVMNSLKSNNEKLKEDNQKELEEVKLKNEEEVKRLTNQLTTNKTNENNEQNHQLKA